MKEILSQLTFVMKSRQLTGKNNTSENIFQFFIEYFTVLRNFINLGYSGSGLQ